MLCFLLNVCQLTAEQVDRLSVIKLTANVDLQFTEVCPRNARKLRDEVSVTRHVGGTRQVDRGAVGNSARVLTADCIVPGHRCRVGG